MDYEEVVCGHPVRWTRQGKHWTVQERQMLAAQIEFCWRGMFSKDDALKNPRYAQRKCLSFQIKVSNLSLL